MTVIRTIEMEEGPMTFTVLPPDQYDPARTGGWVQMIRAGEVRTIYLDLGRLPLDQRNLDERDAESLEGWWTGAAR